MIVQPHLSLFDINCGCGVWPFRPTPPADAPSLERLLRAEGITRACAYPLEAYLWPDPQEGNDLRLPELVRSSFFVPSAVLNPTLPAWRKAYRRCRGEWNVPLVRLLPSYHRYPLTHPSVDALAEQAGADGVALGLCVRAEDERMQNPLAPAPPVPIDEVTALARRHPETRLVAFGYGKLWDRSELVPSALLSQLTQREGPAQRADLPENLWIELSFFEHESSFASALKLFPAERLLFGSHAPLFYPRANIAKIEYSEAPPEAKAAAFWGNAEQLLGVTA